MNQRIATIMFLGLAACQSGVDDGVPPGGDGGPRPDAADGDAAAAADAGPDIDGSAAADEDGDGLADADDNCPSVANPLQEDVVETQNGDPADGIGDACDPRPMQDGDSIVFFDGFNGAGLGAAWTAPLGTWTVDGGFLRQTSGARAPALAYWNGATQTRVRIETEMTLDDIATPLSPADNSRTAGTVVHLDPLAGTGYHCLESADPNDIAGTSQALLYESTSVASGAALGTDSIYWDMVVDDPLFVRAHAKNNAARQLCHLQRPTGQPGSTTANDTTLSSGYAGLETNGVAASFRYVIVYALGN